MPDLRPVLITIDYPPERGGVARYLSELVRASKGKMRVIVPMAHGMSDQEHHVEAGRMFRSRWPRWWPIVRLCRNLKRKEDVVLVSHVLPIGTAAMIAKWFGGPHFIVLLHGLDILLASKRFWKSLLVRIILRQASGVIVNSRATLLEVQKYFGNVTAEVMTPGMRIAPLPDRQAARLHLGIPDGERVILAVARLVERKGIDVLLEAVALLPKNDRVRVVVIGSGPEEGRLSDMARCMSHHVQFIPDAEDTDLSEWYAASDVFCLPIRDGADDFEGFGIVFLEAAAAELPVIAGKAGGVEEAVVDRETGLLVDGADSRAVARALVLLLGDDERRASYGRAGRERVLRDFRWDDRWKQFEAMMHRL